MDRLIALKTERDDILKRRPDLHLMGDFTPYGSRLFEINQEIERINDKQKRLKDR